MLKSEPSILLLPLRLNRRPQGAIRFRLRKRNLKSQQEILIILMNNLKMLK
jgi:hypothetical protein